jgi:hypothetical protein
MKASWTQRKSLSSYRKRIRVTYWLKLGYFTDAQEGVADYWLRRKWVSDGPGRDSSRWATLKKPRRGDTYPSFGPRYEVGDHLVVYITELQVCPAILEVIGEPRWDPTWVDTHAKRGESRQWGVVTPVKRLWELPLGKAPELDDIHVANSSIQRQGHVELKDWQYEAAERLIAKRKSLKPASRKAKSIDAPVEAGHVDGYEVTRKATVQRAERREARLVHDYQAFLETKGDEVKRKKLLPSDQSRPIYSDVFNVSRSQLIEAKASGNRGDIRMAIGQLADYGRFVPPKSRRAVLLEVKPHEDLLDLLKKQKISVIWRKGKGFIDNAGGKFV